MNNDTQIHRPKSEMVTNFIVVERRSSGESETLEGRIH